MKTVIASLFEDRRKRMGRPPCCEKVGIKKGPWTPEEDIVLVSYIQQHGPGNWRAVPTNTGLLRCSKSCRLRWTNYLRPGIKRGNFTSHEEGMIVHLQALLGNKWAAIASYLPQRTDNDIKNYWNTHLKKKLNKNMETNSLGHHGSSSILDSTTCDLLRNPTRDDANHIASSHAASTNLVNQSISSTSSYCGGIYASSTENISRLLEGWMRTSPKSTNNANIVVTKPSPDREENPEGGGQHQDDEDSCDQGWPWAKAEKACGYDPKIIINRAGPAGCGDHDLLSREANKTSMVPFDNLNSVDAAASFSAIIPVEKKKHIITGCDVSSSVQPLSFLEKWLLEEGVGGQVLEDRMMAVSGYVGLS